MGCVGVVGRVVVVPQGVPRVAIGAALFARSCGVAPLRRWSVGASRSTMFWSFPWEAAVAIVSSAVNVVIEFVIVASEVAVTRGGVVIGEVGVGVRVGEGDGAVSDFGGGGWSVEDGGGRGVVRARCRVWGVVAAWAAAWSPLGSGLCEGGRAGVGADGVASVSVGCTSLEGPFPPRLVPGAVPCDPVARCPGGVSPGSSAGPDVGIREAARGVNLGEPRPELRERPPSPFSGGVLGPGGAPQELLVQEVRERRLTADPRARRGPTRTARPRSSRAATHRRSVVRDVASGAAARYGGGSSKGAQAAARRAPRCGRLGWAPRVNRSGASTPATQYPSAPGVGGGGRR